ncbi:MAG: ATP-binding protein [Bacteroidota bacterium]
MNQVVKKHKKWSMKLENNNKTNALLSNLNIDFRELLTLEAQKVGLLKKSNLILTTQVTQKHAFLSNKTKLSLIIRNLIDHAISRMDSQKRENIIDIDIKVTENDAFIEVVDNGSGYAKSELIKIQNSSSSHPISLIEVIKFCVKSLSGTFGVDSSLKVGTHIIIKIPNRHP